MNRPRQNHYKFTAASRSSVESRAGVRPGAWSPIVARRFLAAFVVTVAITALAGCTSMTRAKDIVVDNTRSAVEAIKRTTGMVKAPAASPENAPNAPAPESAAASKSRPVPVSDSFELTGMLSVVRPDGCLASKGCNPTYRLYNENFSVRTALAGDVHEVHDGMLVTLKGRWIPLAGPALVGDSWSRNDSELDVASYEVVSGHRYRDFLVKRADDFAEQTYGCASAWDRSFGWQIVNREPYLIVRMTNPLNRTAPEFVELWYHGKSGKFLRESKSDANVNPCR